MFLSKLSLRRDASVAALLPLYLDKEGEMTSHAGKALVWSVFGGDDVAERTYLWRDDGSGSFLVLSRDEPGRHSPLLSVDAPKRFAPVLSRGDRLAFALRVNPVRRVRDPDGDGKCRKHDVVLHRLKGMSPDERRNIDVGEVRESVCADWMADQGARSGFDIVRQAVIGRRSHAIPKPGSRHEIEFETYDLEGILEVRDPDAFVGAVGRGFGSAKAYGCGLMLLRRA